MYINMNYTRGNSKRCIPARAIIQGWLHKEKDVAQNIQNYWIFRYELSIIGSIAIKANR